MKLFTIFLIIVSLFSIDGYSQALQPDPYIGRLMSAGPAGGAFQQVGVGIFGFFGLLDFERAMHQIDDDGYMKEPTAHMEEHPEAYTPHFVDFTVLSKGYRHSRHERFTESGGGVFYQAEQPRESHRYSTKDQRRIDKIRLSAEYYGRINRR